MKWLLILESLVVSIRNWLLRRRIIESAAGAGGRGAEAGRREVSGGRVPAATDDAVPGRWKAARAMIIVYLQGRLHHLPVSSSPLRPPGGLTSASRPGLIKQLLHLLVLFAFNTGISVCREDVIEF